MIESLIISRTSIGCRSSSGWFSRRWFWRFVAWLILSQFICLISSYCTSPHVNLGSKIYVTLFPHPIVLRSLEGRSFTSAAPSIWNALPLSVRSETDQLLFKSRLNTHLFIFYHLFSLAFARWKNLIICVSILKSVIRSFIMDSALNKCYNTIQYNKLFQRQIILCCYHSCPFSLGPTAYSRQQSGQVSDCFSFSPPSFSLSAKLCRQKLISNRPYNFPSIITIHWCESNSLNGKILYRYYYNRTLYGRPMDYVWK
jgi:hypothetical protein